MTDKHLEVIDSSQMKVLSEFEVSEVKNNIDRFRIGIVNENIIIAGRSLTGSWSGDFLFEKANIAQVTGLIKDVLNGSLATADEHFLTFKASKDAIGIGEYAPRDELVLALTNNRPAVLDGYESKARTIYIDSNTLLKMYVELEKTTPAG